MKVYRFVMMFAIMFALTVAAFAQPGGGGGNRGGGPRGPGFGGPGGPGGFGGGGVERLFTTDAVKERLKLSDEQVTKIQETFREIRESGRSEVNRFPDLRNASDEERRKAFETMREEGEKRQQENTAKIEKILSPEQQNELKVVRFQISGGLEANRPLNVNDLDALNLTSDQKAKIKTALDDAGRAFREGFQQRPGQDNNLSQEERQKAFREMQERGEAIRKVTREKVEAVLTADQKALAVKLTGEGKELRDKLDLQRGNRGGGRGGEGGGYRPGDNSWRPGQGAAGGNNDGEQQPRAFPRGAAPATPPANDN
ncbi:MAG: hypothetical protein LBU65_11500 [Planctomycetaceae bacterium]|nr:hypothetical protein [Planctomycetaceae bacterium]